jgi:membrane protease YdiL (CAAX protease family)
MNRKLILSERSALSAYLILTPLISLAIALFLPLPIVGIALLLLLVPSSLAIVLAALAEGRKGVSELLRKLFQWRTSLKWCVVSLALPIGIILLSGVAAFLLGWSPAVEIHIPSASQLITNLVLIVLVAVLEELGWRGYALPRLLSYRSPLTSALIVGALWGVLHIGIGLADGRPWLPTFLAPFGMSITLTWLFLQTRGSLAMAMLFHFAADYAPQFILHRLPISQAVWSQAIVNLAAALVLILLFGADLQRNPVRKMTVADAAER